MKKQIIYSGMLLSLLLSGCGTAEKEGQMQKANSQEHLLQSVIWYQHSAEMKAAYIQAYNWAARILKAATLPNAEARPGTPARPNAEVRSNATAVSGTEARPETDSRPDSERPLAVVLDIDETVLDNSPQTARQILDGEAFSNEMWDEWCSLSKAKALPGALEFTLLAESLGVEVFYISNRGIHLLDVSLENLNAAGFPFADKEHVLLKTGSSVKDERRKKVRESHDIVLLIGDNLGDFSGIFDNRQGNSASEKVIENRDLFGYEFILLPNPLYGSWEKPFRGETPGQTKKNKMDGLKAYQR